MEQNRGFRIDMKTRAKKIEKFQDERFKDKFNVFLASTQTGGVGLTRDDTISVVKKMQPILPLPHA